MAKRRLKKCTWGKLKNPVGRRVCKKRPGAGLRKARRSRAKSSVAKQEAAMWKSYKSGSVSGYRRRRRRR